MTILPHTILIMYCYADSDDCANRCAAFVSPAKNSSIGYAVTKSSIYEGSCENISAPGRARYQFIVLLYWNSLPIKMLQEITCIFTFYLHLPKPVNF